MRGIMILTLNISVIANVMSNNLNFTEHFSNTQRVNSNKMKLMIKGIFILLINMAGGLSSVNNKNITSLNLENDFHEWTMKPQQEFDFSFNILHE